LFRMHLQYMRIRKQMMTEHVRNTLNSNICNSII
jgi:hypothetical protein